VGAEFASEDDDAVSRGEESRGRAAGLGPGDVAVFNSTGATPTRAAAACSRARRCAPLYDMRKLLVVFLAAVAALGLSGCGGSSSKAKSKPTTPVTTHAAKGSGGNGSSAAALSSLLKCLGRHGVNVQKVAAAKGTGGAGAALRKDPHYATALKACSK